METKDLIIRDSLWEDLDTFYEWERRPEVTEFFSIPAGQTREELTRKYVEDDENPAARQYTILLKDPEGTDSGTGAKGLRMIGRIVLGDLEPCWKVEIWRIYIADTQLRGKGYGRQAMEALMKVIFDDWGIKRLYLDHYTGNPASYLYQNLGFKYEGVLRRNCRKNGELYDVHLMSMLNDEYEKLYKKR